MASMVLEPIGGARGRVPVTTTLVTLEQTLQALQLAAIEI
jgi:hypothetical protein